MILVGRRLLGATLALALIAACSAAPPPAETPVPGAVVVTAQNEQFSPHSVSAPAGEPFVLYFDNRDNSLHNAKLVDGSGTVIVPGELFTGPGSRTADVPALAAGTYQLICDVHPDMRAELIAN